MHPKTLQQKISTSHGQSGSVGRGAKLAGRAVLVSRGWAAGSSRGRVGAGAGAGFRARAGARTRASGSRGVGGHAGARCRLRSGSRGRAGSRGRGRRLGVGLGVRVGLGLVRGVKGGRAGQVEKGRGAEILGNGKLHLVVGVGVAKVVPEGGSLAKQLAAANLVPVVFGILDASLSLIPVWADVWPASLSDPDRLSVDGTNGGLVCAIEESAGVLDVVALVIFVVGVLVDANPVDGLNHRVDGAVCPDIPGINMTNGDARERTGGKGVLEVIDEANNGVGGVADTSLVLSAGDGITVKILATNGHANDEVCELAAVLVNSLLQGAELLVNVVGARGPNSEEHIGLSIDGGLKSLNGVVLRVGLDASVESDGVEGAGGTLEALGGLKLGLKVLLELGRAVSESSARVEAEVVLVSGGGGAGEHAGKKSRETHVDRFACRERRREGKGISGVCIRRMSGWWLVEKPSIRCKGADRIQRTTEMKELEQVNYENERTLERKKKFCLSGEGEDMLCLVIAASRQNMESRVWPLGLKQGSAMTIARHSRRCTAPKP